MRLFLGLPLTADMQRAIARWRDKSLPAFAKPVPDSNFHLTLVFLGEVSRQQNRDLVSLCSGIRGETFTLLLDQVGYWPKQEIFYLSPTETPVELLQLVQETRQVARRCGLKTEKRKYRPHLTLARRCETAPPDPIIAPAFDIACDEFCLFESIRTRSGVRYEILERFGFT